MPITVSEIVQRLNSHQVSVPTIDSRADVVRLLYGAFAGPSPLTLLEEGFPWTRDMRLAMNPNTSAEVRLGAIDRLIAEIQWAPEFDAAKRIQRAWWDLRSLPELKDRDPRELKREILAAAVILVLQEQYRMQAIRVGRGPGSFSLREEDGQPAYVRPIDLPLSADLDVAGQASRYFAESPFLYWFRRQVLNAATANLLNEPYPTGTKSDKKVRKKSRPMTDELQFLLAEAEGAPLLRLLEGESASEAARKVVEIWNVASPRQKELIVLLEDGNTLAGAARILDINPSTARVQIKRLRDKFM